MNDTTQTPEKGRRSFLDALLGIGVLGWLASAVYPVLRYLTPIQDTGGKGPIRLTKDEMSTVDAKGFTIVRSGSTRIIVLKDSTSKVHALSAKCTHEGCTVQYSKAKDLIWCACHNGKFDLTGRNISGPPPRPLAHYSVTRDADGTLVVNLEEQA
jgi:Rieske Fe-S protein